MGGNVSGVTDTALTRVGYGLSPYDGSVVENWPVNQEECCLSQPTAV